MEPTTLAPRKPKPSRWWIVITAVAGAAGALGAIAIAGTGTDDVGSFQLEFRAWPAFQGKTQFAIAPGSPLKPGHSEAGTHRAPIAFRATITGVKFGTPGSPQLSTTDAASLGSPAEFADFLGSDAKGAVKSFAIRVAIKALIGAAAAGFVVSLAGMRFGRIAGAVLAAVLALGTIGILVQQTFDANQFRKTCWQAEGSSRCTRIVPG